MKKIFTVNVTEKHYGFTEIEAESKEEAEELGLEAYNNGSFQWTSSDLFEFEAKENPAQKHS